MNDDQYNPSWNKIIVEDEWYKKRYGFQKMCLATVVIIPFEWVQRFYFQFYEHNFEMKPKLMNEKFCVCRRYININDVAIYAHHYHRICWGSTVRINKMIYHAGIGECKCPVALTTFVCTRSNYEMIKYLLLKGFSVGLYLIITVFRMQKCFYHLFHCKMCYEKYIQFFLSFYQNSRIFTWTKIGPC